MRHGLARVLLMSAIGAVAGAVAAVAGYAFREREPLDLSLEMTVKVGEMTISDELWAIVALTLLGGLVCGLIAAVYVARKGPGRMLLAFVVGGSLGAFLCWGSRWVMDQATHATLGGPEKQVDFLQASAGMLVPWAVWQVGCGFALAMPIAVAIGLNRFTLLRGLIGSVLVMVIGYVLGHVAGVIAAALSIGTLLSGGDITDSLMAGDLIYLFSLGASAGIAFGVSETVYKPAWLKSVRGTSEGRSWALQGPLARIGSQEGVEVYLPPDGTVAPVHAQIQADEDGHYIVPLAGGTAVNGQPAQTVWLRDGDQIGIGSSLLIYRNRIDSVGKERPSAPALHQRQWALADARGGRHLLHPGTNTVGRELGCDVALTFDASVSRRHAEIVVDRTGLTVRDLGSTNGTFVAGNRLTGQVPLHPGDEVVFGRCSCRIEP